MEGKAALINAEGRNPAHASKIDLSFLINRQAKVKFNGAVSKNTMRQGLPQGSVLSLILFLLYINNLANLLPQNNVNAMFADDFSILSTEATKEQA